MECWQGIPEELREHCAVVRLLKRTPEKELVVLEDQTDGKRFLLRNYPGRPSDVYTLLEGKQLPHLPQILRILPREEGYSVLEEFLDGTPMTTTRLAPPEMRKALIQMCDALSALHALGIVHRDIKPEHFLCTEDGQIYLLDLDAARLYKSHAGHDTVLLGTAGYAAPEQFGIVQTDHRADIFALGVTVNHMLTGMHPSQQLCGGSMRRIVRKCTQIDPRARYQTAAAVRRAVRLLWPPLLPQIEHGALSPRRAVPVLVCALLCICCAAAGSTILFAAPAGPLKPQSMTDAEGTPSGTSGEPFADESENSGSISDGGSGSFASRAASGSGSSLAADSSSKSGPDSTQSSSRSAASSAAQSSQSAASANSNAQAPGDAGWSAGEDVPGGLPSGAAGASSGSSQPGSPSSAPQLTEEQKRQEAEIRAAIEEYNRLNAEYEQASRLHAESYERYQQAYGYELNALMGRRDALSYEVSTLQGQVDAAQARADACAAADPPDPDGQAQAQAEADSLREQLTQKTAERDTLASEWITKYEDPAAKAMEAEFSRYAVQVNNLSPQVAAARNKVDQLQNKYGIYLM
ncbi:MAG: protein kinase [Subdoligranulum sp.]|nr:protein kinase [Subdoligranulum sp.]